MRRDHLYLLDMLLEARNAVSFVSHLAFDKFKNSRLHQYAILKAIENIVYAALQVSEETKSEHSNIRWNDICRLSYDLDSKTSIYNSERIHLTALWKTVQNDLPPLIAQLEPLVSPEPE